MRNISKFKLFPTSISLLALVTSLSVSSDVAYSRGFGGGGFGGGGGGFNRGGFSGDFHGQGSVTHSGQGFKSPQTSQSSQQTRTGNVNSAEQTRTGNVNSAEQTRTNNVNSAEQTRTGNVNSAEQTRTNNVNSAEHWNNSYVNNGSWYGGSSCCGGWGAAAAGLATGVVIGASLNSIPAGYVAVPYNGQNYYYVNGNYYLPSSSGYTLVAPPVGVHIATLPTGYTTVYATGSTHPYYYANGFYYAQNAGKYVIVSPPKGAMVPYLPEGYTTTTINGVAYYQYAGVTYRPYYSSGELVYVVN